ncbi:MAG: hypothetical protein J1E02_00160 [Coprobacter sp.]|nr:hypothetical protein [Coprobacter sp.]
MPYRRLPNTDSARIRSLECILRKEEAAFGPQPVLSFRIVNEVKSFLPRFKSAHALYHQNMHAQVKDNGKYQTNLRNARMYISHFIQVLGMCMMRNEIRPAVAGLYGLSPERFTVPDLTGENAVLQWGEKIIKGENLRIQQRGTPIYNPAIAKVSVHYEIFREAFNARKNAMANTAKSLQALAQMREEADKIILEIWNQVEARFASLPEAERLERCREYGVIYYLRKKEKNG